MAGQHVLALDQGTTGTTGLVLDPDARVVGRGYAEFPQHYPRPGWVEHDPEQIWRVTVDVAGRALDDAGVAPTELAGLGITNQRETTLLWDRRTGEPVHNAIVWQDRRTAGICDRLRAEGLGPTFRAKTGLVLDAYFSGTKVAWLLNAVDGLRDRAERGEIAFGTIDCWLVWKLTGGRHHLTDVTNASRTLLYDIYARRWDEELLDILGVPAELLPAVEPSSKVYADTDPAAFLGARVPIAGLVGDQQAALFAQACFERGQAKNSYGTGSFVLLNTGNEPVGEQEELITTIACGIEGQGVDYALEGPIFVTGAAIQWLRDELGLIGAAAETDALASSLDTNDDVYFVPALTGLGAPAWDPYARGTLLGLTRGTTRAHLARATLESIAYQTRDVVEAMRRHSGIALDELRGDGGGTANTFLMQFQADILGVPVDIPDNTESTSLGSGYLAGLATGVWTDRRELAGRRRTRRRYEPRLPEPARADLYGRWRAARERALRWAREEA